MAERRPATLERKLLAGFGSTLLVLVVAAFSYQGLSSALHSKDWVEQTHAAIDLLRSTQSGLLEAERAQQAYFLSPEDRHLADFHSAQRALSATLAELHVRMADNPDQENSLRALAGRSQLLLSELASELDQSSDLNPETLLTRLRKGRLKSKAILTETREMVTNMVNVEKQVLSSRQARHEENLTYATMVLAGGSIGAFLLGMLVNLALRRDVLARRREQQTLEEQAARLAEINQTLAATQAVTQEALSERMVTLRALEKSNRDLDQFAYVASHDLKAPLRGIASIASWLEEDLSPHLTKDSREHLRLLQSRVHRMEALIDGILAYSRAGRQEKSPETLALRPFLKGVVDLICAPPEAKLSIDAQVEVVVAERVPFQQVWMNLANNALKHSKRPDVSIVLSAKDTQDSWEFGVADNGPGIAPEHHERIFRVFQMLHSRDEVEGAGIGLAVVKKLVEAAGGRVWIHSEVGQGARFCFSWPKPVDKVVRRRGAA